MARLPARVSGLPAVIFASVCPSINIGYSLSESLIKWQGGGFGGGVLEALPVRHYNLLIIKDMLYSASGSMLSKSLICNENYLH
jgi:hypothetical protein